GPAPLLGERHRGDAASLRRGDRVTRIRYPAPRDADRPIAYQQYYLLGSEEAASLRMDRGPHLSRRAPGATWKILLAYRLNRRAPRHHGSPRCPASRLPARAGRGERGEPPRARRHGDARAGAAGGAVAAAGAGARRAAAGRQAALLLVADGRRPRDGRLRPLR